MAAHVVTEERIATSSMRTIETDWGDGRGGQGEWPGGGSFGAEGGGGNARSLDSGECAGGGVVGVSGDGSVGCDGGSVESAVGNGNGSSGGGGNGGSDGSDGGTGGGIGGTIGGWGVRWGQPLSVAVALCV